MTLADGRLFHRTPEPFDTADILAEAIREHLHDRRWYRSQPRRQHWADLARDNDVALRALVAVARRARRLAAAAPMTFDDEGTFVPNGWAEAELREAWGR